MLGPVLGALVLVVADWRAIFWLNAVLGVLLAGAVVVTGGGRLPRPRPVVVVLSVLAAAVGCARPRRPRRPRHERVPRPAVRAVRRRDLAPRDADRPRRRRAPPRRARRRRPRRLGPAAARRRARRRARSVARWAASCSPSPRPSRSARWSGRSATPCCRSPPCSSAAYAVHHRRSSSPLVPRGLRARPARLGARRLAARRGRARRGRRRRPAARPARAHREPDRGGPRPRALPRRRAGRGARRRLGAAAPRQRRGRGRRSGAGRRRAGADVDLGPGLARRGRVDGGPRPHRPRHRAGPGPGQRRRARGGVPRRRTARHPRSSSSRGWWGWSSASRCSPPSGCSQYYDAVAALPDPTDTDALKDAAVVQVTSVFRGAAVGGRRSGRSPSLALGLRRRAGSAHATTFGL